MQQCEREEGGEGQTDEVRAETALVHPRWTAKEKRKLLRLLQRYGSNNATVISKYFPRHSVTSIRRLIRVYRIIADHMYEDKLIDQWLTCGLYRPGSAKAIGQAFKLIGLFEERPRSSGLVDFREIYLFLASLILSKDHSAVLPLISSDSLRLILKLITKLENETWPKFQPMLFDYLSKVYKKKNILKDYRGFRRRS